jgi:hypothetical protein
VGAPIQLDVVVDLNTMDDTGLPWTFLDEAIHPDRLVPGAYIIVGSGEVRAVAQVIDVDNDIVHVRPLRDSVASNAHLLDERRPDGG